VAVVCEVDTVSDSTPGEIMYEYWNKMIEDKSSVPEYSRFGRIVSPYWKLERRLVVELSLSYLQSTSRNRKLLILKSDLWNEGIDSSSGDIHDFLGEWDGTVDTVGIDVSPVICSFAIKKMRNEELTIVCADVRQLPFREETFDAIFDVSTIDHIPPNHVSSVLKEYQRTLIKGGILTLIFDSTTFWWCRYLRKIFNRVRCERAVNFKLWWQYPPEWIKDQLDDCDFTILGSLRLGILSLSPLFLMIRQSVLARGIVSRLLYGSARNVKCIRASQYLLPLSSQHLFILRKKSKEGEIQATDANLSPD